MKIGIIPRNSRDEYWGGDLTALRSIQQGFEELGHEAVLGPDFNGVTEVDYVFIGNCCSDMEIAHNLLKMIGKPYGVICFYEDSIQHCGPSSGLFRYLHAHFLGKSDHGFTFPIDRLFENPRLIYYFADKPKKIFFQNYPVIKDAHLCLANSPKEAAIIQRDCPASRVRTVFLTAGFSDNVSPTPSDDFLKLTGLLSKEYILQVGRFDLRKNQMSTILATRDFGAPLVFIATKTRNKLYESLCLEAALRFRKGPTLIISQDLPYMKRGPVEVIPMPNGDKISDETVSSAFAHAALHCHPAFTETPGYTYLESARLGIPTIASEWATIKDYFIDQKTGESTLDDRIEYALPYDLLHLKALVEKKFGKTYPPCFDHPVFQRTKRDMAEEILAHMEEPSQLVRQTKAL